MVAQFDGAGIGNVDRYPLPAERIGDRIDERVESLQILAFDPSDGEPASPVQASRQADQSIGIGRHRLVDRRAVDFDYLPCEPSSQPEDGGMDVYVPGFEFPVVLAGGAQDRRRSLSSDPLYGPESLRRALRVRFEQVIEVTEQVTVGARAPPAGRRERSLPSWTRAAGRARDRLGFE